MTYYFAIYSDYLQLFINDFIKGPIAARICLPNGGYRKIELPSGTYLITEIWRDDNFRHDPEKSDGYTYRLAAEIHEKNQRISVWQNDLIEGVTA